MSLLIIITCVHISVVIGLESKAIQYFQGFGKNSMSLEQFALLVEIAKLCISAIIYNSPSIVSLPIKFPSIVLNHMPSTISSLMSLNLKIPFIVLLTWLFINYNIPPIFLLIIMLLCFTNTTTCFKFSSIATDISTMGFLGILIYYGFSVSAVLFYELVSSIKFKEEDVLSQNIKSCICDAIIIAIRWHVPLSKSDWVGNFVIVFLAINCLFSLLSLKFSSSVSKSQAIHTAFFLGTLFIWRAINIGFPWKFYAIAGVFAISLSQYKQPTSPTTEISDPEISDPEISDPEVSEEINNIHKMQSRSRLFMSS